MASSLGYRTHDALLSRWGERWLRQLPAAALAWGCWRAATIVAYSDAFDRSVRQDSIAHSGGFDQGSERSDE
jgi:hypothetical protein